MNIELHIGLQSVSRYVIYRVLIFCCYVHYFNNTYCSTHSSN